MSLTSLHFDVVNDIDTSTHFTVRELCKVIYSYKPANEDELELKEGDIITILNKDLPDKGWWKGELKGKVGVFPDNFVHLIAGEGESIGFPITTTTKILSSKMNKFSL